MRGTVAIGLACALLVSIAHADEKKCAADAAQARQLRTEGKLKASLDAYRLCAAAECEATRAECAKEYVAVEEVTPSVVVMVRDSKGHDYADAPVIVDGELAASNDGHSIFVDPGMHTFRIGSFDGIPKEQRVMIVEKERNRVLLFFAEPLALSSHDNPSTTVAPASSRSNVWPWVVAGTGVGSVVTGAILAGVGFGLAQSARDQRIRDMLNPPLQSTTDQYSTGATLNHVGIGFIVGGSIAVAVGVVWHIFDKRARTNAASIPGAFAF